MRSLFLSSILLLSIYVKGYSQHIDADTTNKQYIEFGNGGGFTGSVQGYLLTEDGKLFRMESMGIVPATATFVKQVKKCRTKQIFRYVAKNKLETLAYNQPGNMYSFITIHAGNRYNSITWNEGDTETPATIRKLSAKLNKTL